MLCNLIYSGLVAGKLIFDPLNFIRFVLVSSSDKELTAIILVCLLLK